MRAIFARCRGRIRRPLLGATLAAGLVLAGCGGDRHPDVVLVVVDALRADHLGAYGYSKPTSPAVDAVAREGLLFANAQSPATWTKPAMASLFTALYPGEHGIVRMLHSRNPRLRFQSLPRSLPTLAERFQASGYTTLAVVHQPNLGEETGFARGFEVFDHRRSTDDFALVDALLQHIDEAGAQRPLFAWLHLLDVHWPYTEKLADLPLDAFGPIDPEDRLHAERRAVRNSRHGGFRDVDVATLEAWYDHGVAWSDRALGRLVAGLRARGRWPQTLLVVTADHGEGFLEHGRLEHSYLPYDEVTRVPLILKPHARAGIPPGQRASVVGLTGLGPTLVELAGLPVWKNVSGRSFAAIARGHEEPRRTALIETEDGRALRSAKGKIIVRPDGTVSYFDLVSDPGEKRDLAAGGCQGACRKLLGHLRQIETGMRPPLSPEGAAVRFSDEDLAELQALGYL
jgi:arylsulfatase A-like enzyme